MNQRRSLNSNFSHALAEWSTCDGRRCLVAVCLCSSWHGRKEVTHARQSLSQPCSDCHALPLRRITLAVRSGGGDGAVGRVGVSEANPVAQRLYRSCPSQLWQCRLAVARWCIRQSKFDVYREQQLIDQGTNMGVALRTAVDRYRCHDD